MILTGIGKAKDFKKIKSPEEESPGLKYSHEKQKLNNILI